MANGDYIYNQQTGEWEYSPNPTLSDSILTPEEIAMLNQAEEEMAFDSIGEPGEIKGSTPIDWSGLATGVGNILLGLLGKKTVSGSGSINKSPTTQTTIMPTKIADWIPIVVVVGLGYLILRK